MSGVDRFPEILNRLGKYKTGRACLYVTRLANIEMAALEELIQSSFADMQARYEITPT